MMRVDQAPGIASRQVAALDGLRGVAVLLVMASHFGGSLSVLGAHFVDWLPFRLGWTGVDVFFALSGFLITGTLLDAKQQPHFFRNFYARRLLRIAPLYYGAILAVLLLQKAAGPDPAWGDQSAAWSPGSLLWPLAYGENAAIAVGGPVRTGILTHYWSLAVEEHFYLIWPLLVWLCSRRRLAVACGVAIAGSILLRAGTAVAGSDPVNLMGLTPLRVDGLAAGALASLALQPGYQTARAAPRVSMVLAVAATAALAALVLSRHTLSQFDPVLWIAGYTLVATAAAFLIVAVHAPGRAASVLSLPVLRWFGRYSFGLYVWHPIIAVMLLHSRWSLVRPGQGMQAALLATCCAAALSLAVAWLSFHVFEQHFLALKRFFPARHAPLVAPPAATATITPILADPLPAAP